MIVGLVGGWVLVWFGSGLVPWIAVDLSFGLGWFGFAYAGWFDVLVVCDSWCCVWFGVYCSTCVGCDSWFSGTLRLL